MSSLTTINGRQAGTIAAPAEAATARNGGTAMQEGDRVMVYDSPGHPLDHYLYAHVLTMNEAGALVLVDHPGNASNGQQKFVKAEKILTAEAASKLQADAREALKTERDSEKIKTLREQVQHFGFVAEQLN